MWILFVIVIVIGITLVPIMIGARIVGASNTGFVSAFFAAILVSIISFFVGKYIGNRFIAFVVTALAGGIPLAGVLGTSYLKAIGVSIIAAAIQLIAVFAFAGALLGIATVTS